MNTSVWGTLLPDTCVPGADGTNGPDRITKKVYDSESRVTKIQQAYGTSLVRDYATYSFTPNGQMASMTDARGFKASMMYDGFDRQTHWYFPSKTVTGAVNTADYELYGYDANGNRTSLRKRDGSMLTFTYDNLNQMTRKTVPERTGLAATATRDIFYAYDIRGLQTAARFDSISGEGLTTAYDQYGRVSSNSQTMDGAVRTLGYGYDVAGNRTSLTFPDNIAFGYTYGSGGQFDQIRDPASNVLIDYNYNDRNELTGAARTSAAPDQTWSYDPLGRLAATGWADAGSNSVSWSFTRNPASQILSKTQTNDAYSWDAHVVADRTYTTNGLNQYTQVGTNGYCYDANGNLTADGTYVYLYDVENRLVEMRTKAGTTCPSATSGYTGFLQAQLGYDPLGRLYKVFKYINGNPIQVTQFLYDGDALVAEYSGSSTVMLQRHIHGPSAGADDPLVDYSGSSTALANARFLYSDVRGSVVYRADSANGSAGIFSYDEYGQPGTYRDSRFMYTGQAWLAELGMYYYKARMYSPSLGRFMQTDPIGYEDNNNLYGYVANDPVNGVDPTGMVEMDCTGSRICGGGREGLASGFSGRSDVSPTGSRINQTANTGPGRPQSSGNTDPVGGDGRMNKLEAIKHWRSGTGEDVTVDATKLVVKLASLPLRPGEQVASVVLGPDFLVHGSVNVTLQSDGSYQMSPGFYDFDIHRNRLVRNFETRIAKGLAGEGKRFMIHYSGSPRIAQPRTSTTNFDFCTSHPGRGY